MPIQIDGNRFLKYTYHPDYLKPKAYQHLLSNVDSIIQKNNPIFENLQVTESNLILDGGNIVRSKNIAILTNKIFSENYQKNVSDLKTISENQKQKVVDNLKTQLEVEKVIIIPRLPGDWLGHSDGMIRFYNEKTVLMNNWRAHKSYSNNFQKSS